MSIFRRSFRSIPTKFQQNWQFCVTLNKSTMADSENGKKLSPVVADNGPAPVIDLSLDLCVVLEALVVLHGLAEDGVAVAHEGDLHVAGVLGRFCKLPASSGALS